MKQNRVLHLALIVIFASLIVYYFYNNQPRKEKEGMNIFEQGWEHNMKDRDDKLKKEDDKKKSVSASVVEDDKWKKEDDKWKNKADKKKSVSAPVVEDDKWKKGDDMWKNEADKKKSVSAPVVAPFASAPVVSPASNENDESNIKIHNSNNVYMLPKQSVNESKPEQLCNLVIQSR